MVPRDRIDPETALRRAQGTDIYRQFGDKLARTKRQCAMNPLTAQQLVEAFPFDSAPRYLLRDQDAIYGEKVRRCIKSLGIEEVVTTPRSPWQNPFCERVIESIHRDCLDHLIVLNERHLRRMHREYISYYHTCRTHLALNKDPPETRPVGPPEIGKIVAFPYVGGQHHRYGRIAA